MGKVIDGKLLAKAYQKEITDFVNKRISEGKRTPALAVVQVGDDGGSNFYRKNLKKLCNNVNIEFYENTFAEDISEESLTTSVISMNEDKNIDGILLLMPLPNHINSENILNLISPLKDIDGLTEINAGKLYTGRKAYIPSTAKAVLSILETLPIDIEGLEAVVIGRSNVVGKPVAQLLLNKNCTVTVCHSRSKHLEELCKRGDILISAIGRPKFIDENFVKESAVVIDVGTTYYEGKLTGDIDFEKVEEAASFITPVPGGVGSLTTTMLLCNLCEACDNNV